MSFTIDQGLFDIEFTDHHAILGVAVDADLKDIRKRYLAVVRRLHPDSCASDDSQARQLSADLLSKLVNPSYQKLSQERNYAEYCVLLRLKGQQAFKQQDQLVLTSEPARELVTAGDVEASYRRALADLANKQYDQLDRVLDWIGQISELNLVYLMRKEGRGELTLGQAQKVAIAPVTTASGATSQPANVPSSASTKAAQTKAALVEACLRRSLEFELKQDFSRAIMELRDAIRLDPSNSTCHSRLGVIYLKTNQATMAKIHFNKALELNPQDVTALDGKRQLQNPRVASANGTAGAKAAKAAKPAAKADPKKGKSDSGNGGLFGLFGGKKK